MRFPLCHAGTAGRAFLTVNMPEHPPEGAVVSKRLNRRSIMSDFRNPNDPMWQGEEYEPAGRSSGSGWGWLAGAVVIVVLIAIVFGAGHGPTRTAMNENRPMAGNLVATRGAP